MKKKRRLLIVDVDDNVVHPGRALYEQLIERIKKRQSVEGPLAFEEGFFTALDVLYKEADPIDALSWYGQLSDWLSTTVSRDKHRQRESLAKFLASRP